MTNKGEKIMQITCTVKIYYRKATSTGDSVITYTAYVSDVMPGAKPISLHPVRRDLWPTEDGKYIATFETGDEWEINGFPHAQVFAPIEIHKKVWVSNLEKLNK